MSGMLRRQYQSVGGPNSWLRSPAHTLMTVSGMTALVPMSDGLHIPLRGSRSRHSKTSEKIYIEHYGGA